MALDAVQMVAEETGGRKEIDIKRYAKTEKVSLIVTCVTCLYLLLLPSLLLWLYPTCMQIPGGSIEESEVLRGVMLNKDVTHPRMRRCGLWELLSPQLF